MLVCFTVPILNQADGGFLLTRWMTSVAVQENIVSNLSAVVVGDRPIARPLENNNM